MIQNQVVLKRTDIYNFKVDLSDSNPSNAFHKNKRETNLYIMQEIIQKQEI